MRERLTEGKTESERVRERKRQKERDDLPSVSLLPK